MTTPEGVRYICENIADYRPQLSGAEMSAVSNACEQRQIEFSTGRHLLRKLLRLFGRQDTELLRGNSGAAVLPAGYCGSLSHSGGLCAAALSPVGRVVSIGIDIEKITRLSGDECRLFMPPDEYERLRYADDEQRLHLPVIAFSVREAVYKCLNPVYGRWIDYLDAEVAFAGAGDFSLAVKVWGYEGIDMRCRYEIMGETVFTTAVLYSV